MAQLYGKLGKNDWKIDAGQVETTEEHVLGRIPADDNSIPLREADETCFKGEFRGTVLTTF